MPPAHPPPCGVAPAAAATCPLFLLPRRSLSRSLHLRLRRLSLPAPRAASHAHDAVLLRRAADAADRSAGLTSPHPNFGCVIARPQLETDNAEAWVVGEGFLYAQGTPCAELLAAQEAGEHARGATAYLNLEPGDCYGDSTAVSTLVQVLILGPSLSLPSFARTSHNSQNIMKILFEFLHRDANFLRRADRSLFVRTPRVKPQR